MQTFLPYPSFARSVATLDQKRLGKQRVETYQIMKALIYGEGWIHHTVTRMWQGYEHLLLEYQRATCYEWAINRGYVDTCLRKTIDVIDGYPDFSRGRDPWWLNNWHFHRSHQSQLVFKKPEHYRKFFPYVRNDLSYYWVN